MRMERLLPPPVGHDVNRRLVWHMASMVHIPADHKNTDAIPARVDIGTRVRGSGSSSLSLRLKGEAHVANVRTKLRR